MKTTNYRIRRWNQSAEEGNLLSQWPHWTTGGQGNTVSACLRRKYLNFLLPSEQLSAANAQNTKLERQLEEAIDEQRLLKVDLAARKELCDKLDNEKDKLNAELTELNEIKRKVIPSNKGYKLLFFYGFLNR